MFSVETGKKIAITGFIFSLLTYFGGVALNVILTATGLSGLDYQSAMEVYENINRTVALFNSCGYLLSHALAAFGFLCMYMEDREMLLLLTSGSLGVAALPNLFGIFGVDISALGIAQSIAGEGVILAIIYFFILAIYSSYVALFAAHSFKIGNAIFGVILVLVFIWNTFGSFAISLVQANANAYGTMAASQTAVIIGIVGIISSIAIAIVKIIHTAKNY